MRNRWAMPLRPAMAAAIFVLLCAAPAAGQDAASTLRVVVTDASTGEPVREALLRLRGTSIGGAADEGGRLVLRNLAPGTAVVEVTRVGYAAVAVPVSLEPGAARDLAVALMVSAVELEGVKAARPSAADRARQMLESRGFFRRRSAGPGVFMEREEIVRSNARSLAQMLSRHRRLNVRSDALPPASSSRRMRAGSLSIGCQAAFYVDGLLLEGFDINSIQPDDVQALEIYRGSSELPPVFNHGTSGCGAVVIWTRVN